MRADSPAERAGVFRFDLGDAEASPGKDQMLRIRAHDAGAGVDHLTFQLRPGASGRQELKIEVVVDDALVDRAVETIRKSAGTEKIGDGKIFVYGIEQAIRIRTGESGVDAL